MKKELIIVCSYVRDMMISKYYNENSDLHLIDGAIQNYNYCIKNNYIVSKIIGDFDTCTKIPTDYKNEVIFKNNQEETDLEFALRKINKHVYTKIIIIMSGNRFDHLLQQICLIKDKNAVLINEKNKIFYIQGKQKIEKLKYKYLSVVKSNDSMIWSTGLKYNFDIAKNYENKNYVSNEIIKKNCILYSKEKILVIQSND